MRARAPRPEPEIPAGHPGVLSPAELRELATLGEKIRASLACDANGTGVPCRTDRLFAVKLMKRYLAIHAIRRARRPR